MAATVSPRRAELLGDTLRRFVRRGARSHIVKLLAKMRPEDVAIQIRGLTPSEQVSVFRILIAEFPESTGEVLTELEPAQRLPILEAMQPEQIAGLLESMAVDDAVALVGELPPSLQDKVLEIVDVQELAEVQEHLTYEDETAGRIMDSEFFALPETTTVGEAIAALQERGRSTENAFYLYVVDGENHLVGVTSLRQLLLRPASSPLSEIMERSIIKAHTDTDQEEVAQLAARYDLLSIPVTDSRNRLVGIVTVDDILDVFKEEATEDFLKMVGTSADELVYEDRSLKVAGLRLPWLVVNLIGLAVAGVLIETFGVNFKEALFLLTFVPVVMGMGGNIGSQTSTITVRGLATGRIDSDQAGGFVWQQLKVGLLLGLACSLVAALAALGLEIFLDLSGQGVTVALLPYAGVVGVSLLSAIVLASVNGAFIPLLFKRVGIDPAVAAGPLVTTSSDILGIIIYFGMASLLIDRLLH